MTAIADNKEFKPLVSNPSTHSVYTRAVLILYAY